MEWISVNDRLPKHRQKVLFCTKRETQMAVYLDKMINEYGDFENVFIALDGGHYELKLSLVTHWMPLPKPPIK